MSDTKCDSEDIYQKGYDASLSILKNVIPYIDENDFIKQRLSGHVQGIACTLALLHTDVGETGLSEGVMSEVAAKCCEVIVMLNYCRDLRGQFINAVLCENLIRIYRSIHDRIWDLAKGGEVKMEGVGC